MNHTKIVNEIITSGKLGGQVGTEFIRNTVSILSEMAYKDPDVISALIKHGKNRINYGRDSYEQGTIKKN